jgi:hypothetical protein
MVDGYGTWCMDIAHACYGIWVDAHLGDGFGIHVSGSGYSWLMMVYQ